MPIRILSNEIASQIAAGEVVERPASVVKELLENALDAGARSIAIQIENAGRTLIELGDDGEGISEAELVLAVTRHATSKLRNAADLFNISTLGFRGEALASIGSISKMTITSRTGTESQGARVVVEGGRPGKVQQVAAPLGTLVRVEDLFYNVPARLKFLKTDGTEQRNIDAYVTRYALAYPMVRIVLSHDGREAFQTSGSGDRRATLAALYDANVARRMLEVNADFGEIKVEGFVSPTTDTKGNRNGLVFFVNGRWVQDAALAAALMQAYHTLLMVGRYPLATLFITLPPGQVDVNVHPAKAEVRFENPQEIFAAVQRAVKRALLAHTPVPGLQVGAGWAEGLSATGFGFEASRQPSEADQQFHPPASGIGDGHQIESHLTETVQSSLPGMPLLRWVGQIGNTFLVAEGPDGLYLIDQHAAHERVLFEKMMEQQANARIEAQQLLEAVVVTLHPTAARLLEEQIPILGLLGFEVELFGPNAFKVLAMPSALLGSDPSQALQVLVEDFEEDEAPLMAQVEARIIGRVCKRAAIKAGQVLSQPEQQALIHDLESCKSPRTCPHGRPTMIHISLDLLERQFGRRGAF